MTEAGLTCGWLPLRKLPQVQSQQNNNDNKRQETEVQCLVENLACVVL